jgi:hypothetical protein
LRHLSRRVVRVEIGQKPGVVRGTGSSNPSPSSGESVANSVFAKALPSDFHRNVVLSFQEDAIGIRLRDAPPWRSH